MFVFHSTPSVILNVIKSRARSVEFYEPPALFTRAVLMFFQCEGLRRNQQVCSSLQINRGIMGGLTIDIGEKYIDLSIATRIKKIEALLKDASIE